MKPRGQPLRRSPRARRSGLPYTAAADIYHSVGVDAEEALRRLAGIPVSLHCWQGDDVTGFEQSGESIGGGLAVTGNHPGRARNAEELRQDVEKALSLVPGKHRLNLHAIYGEFGGKKVERDAIEPRHFEGWIEWARQHQLGLDFNPTFFAHPRAASGWTLAHPDRATRDFWIEHGRRCREIAAVFGKKLGTPSVCNVWIPDGWKDQPADRYAPRERLTESLDAVFAREFPRTRLLDAVEPKLFGLGSECYVAGSHEFYLGYAITRRKLLCLDTGHYHPTEEIPDKLSAVFQFIPELLLHVSRGVRWDSDHVVTLSDPLLALTREVVQGGRLDQVHFGLDYFDASINRIAAWVIGTRNLLKAILIALLEPAARIRDCENSGDLAGRLAAFEASRTLPWGIVWDEYCRRAQVPGELDWMDEARKWETAVLTRRA